MKSILMLLMMVVGTFSEAFASCPEFSGKFGGWCEAESSCYRNYPVYYGMEISQKDCKEVRIVRMSFLGPILSVNYPVGVPKDEVVEKGFIRSQASYSGDSLVISEIYSTDLSQPSATFGTNTEKFTMSEATGVKTLAVDALMKGTKCQVATKCLISPQ